MFVSLLVRIALKPAERALGHRALPRVSLRWHFKFAHEISFKQAKEIKVGVVGYGGAFNMGRSHLLEMQKAGMTPRGRAAALPPARRN